MAHPSGIFCVNILDRVKMIVCRKILIPDKQESIMEDALKLSILSNPG